MDAKFTERLEKWLDTPQEERDYADGAMLMLQLSGNKIMYRNVMANLDRKHDYIEYQLRKYYGFRIQELTHNEVKAMEKEVEAIVERNIPLAAQADKQPKGKRTDHDSLPDEIKAVYVENLSLLRRMRELHMKLRSLTLENATCPDSERYPFLKELISLDKKMHSNWQTYDTYVAPVPTATKPKKPASKPKAKSKTA